MKDERILKNTAHEARYSKILVYHNILTNTNQTLNYSVS